MFVAGYIFAKVETTTTTTVLDGTNELSSTSEEAFSTKAAWDNSISVPREEERFEPTHDMKIKIQFFNIFRTLRTFPEHGSFLPSS